MQPKAQCDNGLDSYLGLIFFVLIVSPKLPKETESARAYRHHPYGCPVDDVRIATFRTASCSFGPIINMNPTIGIDVVHCGTADLESEYRRSISAMTAEVSVSDGRIVSHFVG